MKKILLTLLCILILVVGGLLAVAYLGIVDVAATTAHNDAVEWFLVTTRDRSIDSRAERIEVPPLDDPRMLRTGLEHYHAMCVTCHGAPGVDPAELAQGLNPMPPDLYSEKDSPAETFWVVKHGIRMTGMPAFGPTHSDDALWALTAFVQRLPDLSAEDYAQMVANAGLGAPGGGGHDHEHGEGHEHAGGHEHGEGGQAATPAGTDAEMEDGHDHGEGHSHDDGHTHDDDGHSHDDGHDHQH